MNGLSASDDVKIQKVVMCLSGMVHGGQYDKLCDMDPNWFLMLYLFSETTSLSFVYLRARDSPNPILTSSPVSIRLSIWPSSSKSYAQRSEHIEEYMLPFFVKGGGMRFETNIVHTSTAPGISEYVYLIYFFPCCTFGICLMLSEIWTFERCFVGFFCSFGSVAAHMCRRGPKWLRKSHFIFTFCTCGIYDMLPYISTRGRCFFVLISGFPFLAWLMCRHKSYWFRKSHFIFSFSTLDICAMLTINRTPGRYLSL